MCFIAFIMHVSYIVDKKRTYGKRQCHENEKILKKTELDFLS